MILGRNRLSHFIFQGTNQRLAINKLTRRREDSARHQFVTIYTTVSFYQHKQRIDKAKNKLNQSKRIIWRQDNYKKKNTTKKERKRSANKNRIPSVSQSISQSVSSVGLIVCLFVCWCIPCQNDKKITDLMIANFRTGSYGVSRSLVAK